MVFSTYRSYNAYFRTRGNQLDMYSNSKAARSSSLCAYAFFFCLLLVAFSPVCVPRTEYFKSAVPHSMRRAPI